MQFLSIGSVPLVAVLSTPAACYSASGSGNCFAHKVEHGMHSTNECTGTYQVLMLEIALKGNGCDRRTRCIRTPTAESETYKYMHDYQISYTTLLYTH